MIFLVLLFEKKERVFRVVMVFRVVRDSRGPYAILFNFFNFMNSFTLAPFLRLT